MKVDLAGRVALITGSGQGIGQAMAYAFSENGAMIAVNDIKPTGEEPLRRFKSGEGRQNFTRETLGTWML